MDKKPDLSDIYYLLGSIEATQKSMYKDMERITPILEEHERKLEALQEYKIRQSARMATIATIAGGAVSLLMTAGSHLISYWSK